MTIYITELITGLLVIAGLFIWGVTVSFKPSFASLSCFRY